MFLNKVDSVYRIPDRVSISSSNLEPSYIKFSVKLQKKNMVCGKWGRLRLADCGLSSSVQVTRFPENLALYTNHIYICSLLFEYNSHLSINAPCTLFKFADRSISPLVVSEMRTIYSPLNDCHIKKTLYIYSCSRLFCLLASLKILPDIWNW